jgi:putative nucleotidyltransferase with HDIG domain
VGGAIERGTMDDSRVARPFRFDSVAAAAASALAALGTGLASRLGRVLPLIVTVTCVIALASALLVAATRSAGAAVPPDRVLFLLWVGLLVVTELTPSRMPRGGFMTVSSAFDYAAVILFGPLTAAWIDLVSGVVAHGLLRPRHPVRVAYNLATYVLAAFAGGAVYAGLGGSFGHFALDGRHLIALCGLGLTYFAVNTGLVSLALAAESGADPWRVWQVNYRWTLRHLLAVLPLGALVALAYLTWGFPALGLFLLPLFLVRHTFSLYVDMREDLVDFSTALVGVIEEVDPYTRRHSIRVAAYAERLARGLGRPESEVEKIRLAGLLHDLGKVGQTGALLQKPGRLDPEEFRRIQAHPAAGADIVARIRAFSAVATLVRCHHERIDGAGYPARLEGNAIPLGSRIVLVADAFDAMTSDRPYRPGMSPEAAIAELRRHAGTQFDSRIVSTLVRLRERGEFEVIRHAVGDLDIRLAG